MMLHFGKFWCFIIVILPFGIVAQDKPEYAVTQIDPVLLENANAVIRFEKTEYIINSPREYTHRSHRVVTIFKEESDESIVSVPYTKYSKAELIYANLYDASGKFLRKIKRSEIKDQAYYDGMSTAMDDRYIAIQAYGGNYPFTVEYQWQIIYHQTMNYNNWTPQEKEESVEEAVFVLDTPKDLKYETLLLNHTGQYHKDTTQDRTIQIWKIVQNKAVKIEPSSPPDHELLPMLFIAPEVFQVEHYTGSMSDWKSYGTFMYELNKDRENMPTAMIPLIRQMTANAKSTHEKIDTLYRWLQHNIRYVSVQLGIGGWQSFDAAYVERNRYGDCKALSTFMKGMLEVIGIDAQQVLIKWDEEEGLFKDDFVTLDFNHMMLHIPQENMWLECTSNFHPTGFIDSDEYNKKVLLITPEGGKISHIPSLPAKSNKIITIDTLRFSENVYIQGTRQYLGSAQDVVRMLSYYLNPEERKEYFLKNFPLSVNKLDNFTTTVENPDESFLNYTATLTQLGNKTGDRYFIPVNPVYLTSHLCTDRETDFITRDDLTRINNIWIAIPEGYTIEHIPAKSNYTFRNNNYLIDASFENGMIHVQHRATESPMRLTPEEYRELCKYYRDVAKANSQAIVLKKSKT